MAGYGIDFMKRDYKTLFWILASLLVAFCARAVPPKYVGNFVGDGNGLTNLNLAITNQWWISPNGSDANNGTSPQYPILTISNLMTKAYLNSILNFAQGTYVIPFTAPLVLSNNIVHGNGATIMDVGNSQAYVVNFTNPFVVRISGDVIVNDLTVKTVYTNDIAVPIGAVGSNMQENATIILNNVKMVGTTDGLLFVPNFAWTNTMNIYLNNPIADSAWDSINFGGQATGNGLNTLIVINNPTIYGNSANSNRFGAVTNPALYPSGGGGLGATLRGIIADWGKVFISGGSITLTNGGAATYGIDVATTTPAHPISIADVMMSDNTISGTAPTYFVHTINTQPLTLLGHPYPENKINSIYDKSGHTTFWPAWATNKPWSGAFLQSDANAGFAWSSDGRATTNIPTGSIVGGMTTNINVLIAGSLTNQLRFSSGILTNVVPQ